MIGFLWLLGFSIIFLRFIHGVAFFLLPNNIPLYGQTIFCLPVVCFYLLTFLNNAVIWLLLNKVLFGCLFLFLLGNIPRSWVARSFNYFNLLRSCRIVFFNVTTPFYIFTSSGLAFRFSKFLLAFVIVYTFLL